MTIEGTEEEMEILEGMLAGATWVKYADGKTHAIESFKSPPAPADDPVIPPKWQSSFGARKTDPRLIDTPKLEKDVWYSPSYIVQHLCGYGYSEEGYRENVFILQEAGFECCRSRRGKDGHFWELWFLPGAWAAKGKLRKELDELKDNGWEEQVHIVMNFLMRDVSFGTADVCVQRAAMVID